MKSAGLLFDDSPHYVDHLAPFCALRGWPLFVCEPHIAEVCRRFYPGLEVREVSVFELREQLPSSIVACESKALLEHALGQWLPTPLRTMWLPHGHSDKGWHEPFFEALERDDLLFVYGERMREALRAKSVGRPQESVGNFRLRYYERHRSFYEALILERFGSKRFVLYAPTWEATFWDSIDALAASVPRLMVKLHPNTVRADGARLEQCKARWPHVTFVDDFPCVYPLLSRADAYIGDMSSVGYDMLAFNKPLFFLARLGVGDPSAYLMQCGKQIWLNDIPKDFGDDGRSAQRAAVFAHAFDTTLPEAGAQTPT